MDPRGRIDLIKKGLKDLLKKVKEGSALAYLILSEESGEKYVQCTISREQDKVIIDIPETTLSDDEIRRMKEIISDVTGEEAIFGLQIQTTLNEAPEIIDHIFTYGFQKQSDYTINAKILE